MSDPALSGRRVLVVEDLPAIRDLLRLALEEAGAEVVTAAEGKAALAILDTVGALDLILLDLAMPGMGGWQFLEALGGRPELAAVPVILQTSAEDLASVQKARRREVAAFISKPFRLGEVIETCRRVLEGARPFLGRSAPSAALPAVRVRDEQGVDLAAGTLLGRDARGAQIQIDRMLSPGQRVWLLVAEGDAPTPTRCEVRWVARAGDRYHHGLTVRED